MALRFFAQASSLEPVARGLSLPKLIVVIRLAGTPLASKYAAQSKS